MMIQTMQTQQRCAVPNIILVFIAGLGIGHMLFSEKEKEIKSVEKKKKLK